MPTNSSTPARRARAKRQTLIATGNLSAFSIAELAHESADLQRTLYECEQFSPPAQRVVRSLAVQSLCNLNQELTSRLQHSQPAVAR